MNDVKNLANVTNLGHLYEYNKKTSCAQQDIRYGQ